MKSFYERRPGLARTFQEMADYHDRADKWGAAMSLWFDVAGTLDNRAVSVPEKWQYCRGATAVAEVSEHLIDDLNQMSQRELVRLGEFCCRLSRRLDRANLSY